VTPATPTAQVDRRVIGVPASLALTPYDDSQGSELTLAAEPAPSVSVSDGAGVEVHAGAAAISTDEHSLSATIPSDALPMLDSYLVRWSATAAGVAYLWTTILEVCGGHLFTLAAMRASRSEFASLPTEQLLAARTLAEARFEEECRVAFVPRGARERLRGDGSSTLLLARVALREVIALAVDGASWSAEQIAALIAEEAGILRREDGWPAGAVVDVHYSHGYDRPEAPVTDAALRLAREYAFPDSRLPPRAVLQATEYGSFRLATPGRDGATGLPDVDAVIARYSRERPALG
jgi:hypothetical protein